MLHLAPTSSIPHYPTHQSVLAVWHVRGGGGVSLCLQYDINRHYTWDCISCLLWAISSYVSTPCAAETMPTIALHHPMFKKKQKTKHSIYHSQNTVARAKMTIYHTPLPIPIQKNEEKRPSSSS